MKGKRNLSVSGGCIVPQRLITGCGSETASRSSSGDAANVSSEADTASRSETSGSVLEDGVYSADFSTDSSMFHVSEACDGKGTLTVENGTMTIHISLASKNIVNLYPDLPKTLRKTGQNFSRQPSIPSPTATVSPKKSMALTYRFRL